MSFTVAIVGGGIGGLALAHGLRGAGVDVQVYERDETKTDRLQGYRIHLSPKGSHALYNCLPEDLYAKFIATTGTVNTTMGFFDQDMRELLVLGDDQPYPSDYVDSYKSVNRTALRQVLISGLGGSLRLGKRFERYEHLPDGRVRLHFADGSGAEADLVVAADGTGSRVRQQYLPQANPIDTGAFVISGKVALDSRSRGLLPAAGATGPYMVFGPGGLGMFIAAHRSRTTRDESAPVDLLWDDSADYIMWNLVTTWDKLGDRAALTAMTGTQLRDTAREAIGGWDATLRDLVDRSNLQTVMIFPFTQAKLLDNWQPSNITLLGDAIHCMPPTAGQGANTAIRDADTLREAIMSIADGKRSIVEAVGGYEVRMREYAYPIVKEAVRNLNGGTKDSRFAHAMTTRVFRTINAIGPIRRKMSRAMTQER